MSEDEPSHVKVFPIFHVVIVHPGKISNPSYITGYESTCTSIEDESQAGSEFKESTRTAAGHRFLNVNVEGKVHIGDSFSNEWNGKTGGRVSHIYDGVQIAKEGRAQMGNKFGGKDFWDK
ncbi:small s protein [Paecilomyces variotii No. 5]|uniref:Small s protein n=1 Tax=Byssochlamys spectabilis (strain No. 5 / NBRC 109023) TaxID=1356009 RepID=V5FSG4_BYSSN|nr:small s protein [Paecilomyces variotii No. 5]